MQLLNLPPVEHEMERKCIECFHSTGDLQSLLVLADWIAEFEKRPRFERLLREVAAAANPAVHWFYANANYSHAPEYETIFQGRLRMACQLAWAEADYYRRIRLPGHGKWLFRWDIDLVATAERDNEAGNDLEILPPLWQCTLLEYRISARGSRNHVIDSLGGIDLGEQSPPDMNRPVEQQFGVADYSRVVQAQMAHGCCREGDFPEWMWPETIELPEHVVFRIRRERVSGDKVKIRERGDLFAIIPTAPARMLMDHPEYDAQNLSQAFHLSADSGELLETAVTYSGFTRRSEPVTGLFVASDPECQELLKALKEKAGIIPVVDFRAPANYLYYLQERRRLRREQRARAKKDK